MPTVPNAAAARQSAIPRIAPRTTLPVVWPGIYVDVLLKKEDAAFRLYNPAFRKSVLIDREVVLEKVKFPNLLASGDGIHGRISGQLQGPGPSADLWAKARKIERVSARLAEPGYWIDGYRPKKAAFLILRGREMYVVDPSPERY